MKTKLYKRFVKYVCKDLGISKKQLFARDFNECVFPCYKLNLNTNKIEKDVNRLIILSHKHPLSQIWDAVDMHNRWLVKHWRFSHWKPYIQTNIDLGKNEKDAIIDVIQGKVK